MVETYVQALPDRAVALEMHRRAALSGLAPPILGQDRETVTFERLPWTLRQWWLVNNDAAARADMKVRLRARIGELHAVGICHRDLHSENVMIGDDGSIRFIDFVLAQWVDPNWPCYDLVGPSAHVPAPYAHATQAGHENGVWWGPAISERCLASVIGDQPA